MPEEMKKAVDFIYSIPKFTKKNSLEHTRQLMTLLGSPCLSRKVIHVAGSNGKGSVSCFLYHMLLEGGKSAALFTSPHLVDIRERFQINGKLVGEDVFLATYRLVREASDALVQKTGSHPTFFEFLFAMGMVIFEQADVEYVVLETGLGGRLDATNSFPTPALTVITSISLEHTEYLGDTLAKIAGEKAGILKQGVPLVFSANEPEAEAVIRAHAAELHCPCKAIYPYMEEGDIPEENAGLDSERKMFQICEIKKNYIDFFLWNDYHGKTRWRVPFSAPYQVENAAVAITAMQTLKGMVDRASQRKGLPDGGNEQAPLAADTKTNRLMGDDTIQRGLMHAHWPGRMQQVLPDVYFDGAHNPSGIKMFVEAVRLLEEGDVLPPMLLFSMVRDKDIRTSIAEVARVRWDSIAVTAIPDDRGTPGEELRGIFATEAGLRVESYGDYREAWQVMLERKQPGQKLFCSGSLYFIGALLQMINV